MRLELNGTSAYAEARNIWIKLALQNGHVELSVVDDGRGTNLGHLSLADLVRGGHFGLVGMHEWARLAGGQLHFNQRDGGGTMVSLTLAR